jgi:uroporphyrinogen-III synthase
MSFAKAVWTKHSDLVVIAIGDITAATMRAAGTNPVVVGDGSLEGTLMALNDYLTRQGS